MVHMNIETSTDLGVAWKYTPAEAIALQKQLASEVVLQDDVSVVNYVAGVDVGFENNGEITRAVIAVLSFPALELVEVQIARLSTTFPYVPGLLSFRELPAVLAAMSQLQIRPDLILCDGQGVAHPRRFGIACHLGVLTGMATIGVGKSRLCGRYVEPANERGVWSELIDKQEVIGAVLRSRVGVKPIFVSPGHRISLLTSIEYVMRCLGKYKLPETTRWAHYYASVEKDFTGS